MSGQFENPSMDEIRNLMERIETIAVVGLSPLHYRPSHRVAKAMRHFGYRIIPVNPHIDEVFGSQVYPSLREVPLRVDLVNVFRAPKHIPGIVDECIALGLPALWLQQGVVDNAQALRAQALGIMVIMDRCIWRDYNTLMDQPTSRAG